MEHKSLEKFFDKKLAQAGPLPDPLEMGIQIPRSTYLCYETIADIKQRRKRVLRKLKKYVLL